MEGSPSIAGLFTHMHFVRLVFVFKYHHGQMKVALKMAGRPLTDGEAGPVTWGVWMRKSEPVSVTPTA
jgi:hypothetical protein